jgi:methionyl-tRNA formyltransferase
MNSKITLYLMSYKGYYVLQKFLSEFSPSLIDKVISSEDNNVENDFYKEIKSLAESSGIYFYNKNDSFEITTTYVLAISWRWIIGLDQKLIILHDSILPCYRGFSPLVNSLINNEKYIGVTAIFANLEYDTGDIIEQKEIEITYPIKIFDAIKLLTPLYYEIIKSIIIKISNNKSLVAVKQDDLKASYCLWRGEDDYEINWEEDSIYIRRFIDASGFPFLGASSYLENKKVRIFEAEEYEDLMIENRIPGKVIFLKNGNPVVVCGKGLLLIKKIIEVGTGNSLLPLRKIRTRFT